VNIKKSKFENINRIGVGNGSVIEGHLESNNGKILLIKDGSVSNSFKNC
jgi:hypothetical protein